MRNYGLIGYPLGHSFSKKYFAEKFQNEKLTNVVYDNYPIDVIDKLPGIISQTPGLVGLNVTIPYKEKVIRFLNSVDPIAQRIGAVNTIKIDPQSNTLKGFNTDYYGFMESIKPQLKSYHTEALILGTGGASKAVYHALKDMNITPYFVSRNPVNNDMLSYDGLNNELMERFKVIVNCSPIGTFPNVEEFPKIPYAYITEKHLLYDLVYNPPKTKFLQFGEKNNATIINGQQMLILQAEKSWEIWNNEA